MLYLPQTSFNFTILVLQQNEKNMARSTAVNMHAQHSNLWKKYTDIMNYPNVLPVVSKFKRMNK
jgi:hypothetical protein